MWCIAVDPEEAVDALAVVSTILDIALYVNFAICRGHIEPQFHLLLALIWIVDKEPHLLAAFFISGQVEAFLVIFYGYAAPYVCMKPLLAIYLLE